MPAKAMFDERTIRSIRAEADQVRRTTAGSVVRSRIQKGCRSSTGVLSRLAKKHRCSLTTIHKIANRETYKHIP